MIDKLRELETIIAPWRKLLYPILIVGLALVWFKATGDKVDLTNLIQLILSGGVTYAVTNEPKG